MARFPDGARVCFVGDSITATFNHEGRIADFYRKNFRNSKIRIYNCGVAGGTAVSQRTYLEDDTFIHNPTHAVVMLGVNDSQRWLLSGEKTPERYAQLERAYENYKKNLVLLCDELEKKGIEITLCTPAPYAEYQETSQPAFKGGYALMLGYAQVCRQLAKERSYPLCDYHTYLTKVLQTESIYGDDHIHPTDKGQYYMAKCFLEFQGLEIGEYAEMPENFSELIATAMILRNILAVELMVIHDYSLPQEEKFRIVKDYIDTGRAPTDYFKKITAEYMKERNNWDKHMKRVRELTDELMG